MPVNPLKALHRLPENQDLLVNLDLSAHPVPMVALALTDSPAVLDLKAHQDPTVLQVILVLKVNLVAKDHLANKESLVFVQSIAVWMVVYFSPMAFGVKQLLRPSSLSAASEEKKLKTA
jgi:hypothetical protein